MKNNKIVNSKEGEPQYKISPVYFAGKDEEKLLSELERYVFNNKKNHKGAFGKSTVIKIALTIFLKKEGYLKK